MKKSTISILLLVNGFAYYGIYLVAYIHTYFYDAVIEALGVSNTAFGVLAGTTGVLSIICYALGGLVADRFDTKTLMITANAIQILSMLAYSTFPTFGLVLVIQIVSAITCNLLYWGAMAKYIRSLGEPDQEGRLYGLHFAAVGVGGTILGLMVAAFIGSFGSAWGLRYGLYVNAGVNLLAIFVNLFLYKPRKVEISEDEKFKVSNAITILKMPNFWLATAVLFCLYTSSLMLSYAAPMLRSNFGAPLVLVSIIGTFRTYIARIVCTPVGGMIIDKTKSSIRLMAWMMIACLACAIAMLVMPWNASFFIPAAIVVVVLSLSYNLTTPAWFTPMTDIRVPDHMRGTAVGLFSALAFSLDAFAYVLCGSAIDNLGDVKGYIVIYSVLVVMFILGIVAAVVLMKRLKKLSQAV